MRYLLDTNIWLARLLDQEHSEEVGQLLAALPSDRMAMSDFTLHSIGVILGRLGSADVLVSFVKDIFINGAISLVTVPPVLMDNVASVMKRFGLDFDDAYQYVAAEQADAHIVSYDKDFDGTDRKRVLPADILANEV